MLMFRKLRRAAASSLVAVLAAFVLVGGPSGSSAEPASAIDLPNPFDVGSVVDALDICPGFLKDAEAPLVSPYRSGIESITPMISPYGHLLNAELKTAKGALGKGAKPYGNRPVTLFEQFGSSGLKWTRYDEKCAVWPPAANMFANFVFGLSTSVTSLTIGFYAWATDPHLLDTFMEPVGCVIKGCRGNKGLVDTLYLTFLTPVIVMGALWLGWTGLVKRSTTQAWQGGLWMVLSAAFALFFMANPTYIAETGNSLVSNVNAITANAITSASSSATPKDDVCYLPTGTKLYGPRTASCSIWNALAFAPWTAGQFGSASADGIKDKNNSCKIGSRTTKDIRVTQLCSQTQSHDEGVRTGLAGAVWANFAGDKAKDWEAIAEQMGPGSVWGGADPLSRVNIAFASLFASMAAGFIIMIISFSNVVLAIGMVFLIMAAPLFLLLGAHPGVGRGIALKWLELLIGTVVKRIALGFVLALMVGMYQIIIVSDMGIVAKDAMIMAVGLAAMIYRKPLMEAFNVVNLGGNSTITGSEASQAAKKVGGIAVGAAAGGIAAGVVTGGAAAVAGGVLAGAMSRGGTGNPVVQSAITGGRAGRRSGRRQNAKKPQPDPVVSNDPPTDPPPSGPAPGGPPPRPGGGGADDSGQAPADPPTQPLPPVDPDGAPPPAPLPVAPPTPAAAPAQDPTPATPTPPPRPVERRPLEQLTDRQEDILRRHEALLERERRQAERNEQPPDRPSGQGLPTAPSQATDRGNRGNPPPAPK